MKNEAEIRAKLSALKLEAEADDFEDPDNWDWSDCTTAIATLEWVLGENDNAFPEGE
jgi:hypothetical protein